MRRRDFIALLGGAASAVSFGLRAQAQATPVIGFLNTTSRERVSPLLTAFRKGLSGAGYVEGRNVTIEYRWAEGHYDRLEALTTDLLRLNPAVIATTGGTVAGKAAKAVTSTTPVLFIAGFDPVHEGLVERINRPGGNATGVAVYSAELGQKRLEILQKLVPGRTVLMLVNPKASSTPLEIKDAQDAARLLGFTLIIREAENEREIEEAFSEAARHRATALFVSADSLFTSLHPQIVAAATRHALPGCYPWPQYVDAGGLISYGASLTWAYEVIGEYAARILKGEKPGDLPVQLPSKFSTTINLKTAKILQIEIPLPMQVSADRVIE